MRREVGGEMVGKEEERKIRRETWVEDGRNVISNRRLRLYCIVSQRSDVSNFDVYEDIYIYVLGEGMI